MIDTIIKFFRYLCGSVSCRCRSSCKDHCTHDDCNCVCLKKDNIKQKEIINKSLKEVSKK